MTGSSIRSTSMRLECSVASTGSSVREISFRVGIIIVVEFYVFNVTGTERSGGRTYYFVFERCFYPRERFSIVSRNHQLDTEIVSTVSISRLSFRGIAVSTGRSYQSGNPDIGYPVAMSKVTSSRMQA